MPIRPPSSVVMAILKPLPTSPSRFSFGTMQSSKTSSQVEEPRMPIFFSWAPTLNPGKPFSTMNAEMPLFPRLLSVIAKITNTLANPALVMKILLPLSTQWSPLSSATVFCMAESVPAPGSVRPKAPSHSPEASLVRYFCFCSSVPYSLIGQQHRELWADTITDVVAQCFASSSHTPM